MSEKRMGLSDFGGRHTYMLYPIRMQRGILEVWSNFFDLFVHIYLSIYWRLDGGDSAAAVAVAALRFFFLVGIS